MKKQNFDTLSQSENLIRHGFSTEQANALTHLVSNAIAANGENLLDVITHNFATKQELQASFNALDKKIDSSIHDIDKKIDTKINELDKKIDTKINDLDKKINTKMSELDQKILKMTVGLGVSVGAWTSLLKWIG